MKHFRPVFITLICFFLCGAGVSPAHAACKRPEAPYSGLFQGVKAVGLAVMNHPGDHMEVPPALERKYLLDLFSSRIREHIMPYLEPNEECKIPDIVLFDWEEGHDRGPLWAFINRPDTLTVQIYLRYQMRSTKTGLGAYYLGLRYLRSGPSALKNWEMISWPEQVFFPENEPVDSVEELVTKLAGHIFVLAPGSDTMDPSIGKAGVAFGKDEKPKPYSGWIPLPPPPAEKRPSFDIVE
ncbi:MAG: hypothetical protein ACAH83_11760 [Alphaproteobacteria bacterium]